MKIFLALLLCIFSWAAVAAESATLEHSTVRLIAASTTYQSGQALPVGVHVLLEEGWHTYAKNPGDAGIPTTVAWTLPAGFEVSALGYPPHETFKEGELTTYGYKGEVVFSATITPPSDASGDATITAKAAYLICKEICIPQEAELTLTLPQGEFTPSDDVDLLERFSKSVVEEGAESVAQPAPVAAPVSSMSLATALVFALLGGIILNLMPCVFPVLSLKALSIAKAGEKERAHVRLEALAYTGGILVCFWAIVGTLIGLGEGFGWGFQFQSPAFVAVMALLMIIIALNLFGMFELPVLLGSAEIKNPHSIKGSFATGLLATLVATPCTAPFMAPAIGFALTQPPAIIFATFTALGLGLALPFLMLAYIPAAARLLPRSGAWLGTFKQFLAFPMLATALWLTWVVGTQTGVVGMAFTAGMALAAAFLIWLKGRFGRPTRWCHVAMVFVLLGLASVLAQGLSMMAQPVVASAKAEAIPYSKEQLEMLRASGTPVFLDATASWCITCQVNYRVAIGTEEVQAAFKEKGVVFMVADWTLKDPAITELLTSFGFKGVPMNVYYPPNAEPIVLPQVLTVGKVLEVIGAKK